MRRRLAGGHTTEGQGIVPNPNAARPGRGRWATLRVVAALIATAAVPATAAVAVACVPEPLISLQPISAGRSGSTVVVEGVGFGKGPVEIRWNAIAGSRLADAEGPTFTTSITVPSVPEGLYAVLALARDADGGITNAARAAFQVTAEEVTRSGAPRGEARAPRGGDDEDHGGSAWSGSFTAGVVGAGAGATAATAAILMASRRRGDGGL